MNEELKALLDSEVLPKFHKQLERGCILYKTIGMRNVESPKWQQLREVDRERKILRFKSSQCSVWFNVGLGSLSEEEIEWLYWSDFADLQDYFRTEKYKYINEHHPTIDGGSQAFLGY